MVEVVVAGKQGKVVLQGQCCNPQIIGRDWSTLDAQSPIETGKMMSRLLVGIKSSDRLLTEKQEQCALVLPGTRADKKTCPELS